MTGTVIVSAIVGLATGWATGTTTSYHMEIVRYAFFQAASVGAFGDDAPVVASIDMDCVAADATKGRTTLTCQLRQGRMTISLLLPDGQKTGTRIVAFSAPVVSTWSGDQLIAVSNSEGDEIVDTWLATAIGALEVPGRPTTCLPGTKWRWRKPRQMMHMAGTYGPSSTKTDLQQISCDGESVVSESAIYTQQAGWSSGSAAAERFTYEGSGRVEIDLQTGQLQHREFQQILQGASTTSTRGYGAQSVLVVALDSPVTP